jgi:hypothetical protein
MLPLGLPVKVEQKKAMDAATDCRGNDPVNSYPLEFYTFFCKERFDGNPDRYIMNLIE